MNSVSLNPPTHLNDEQVRSNSLSYAMELPTFTRQFQMRKGQIMWFLGAGASRAGGIKTAGDMIWEFKQKLYCSEKKVALSFIADPGEPIVQRKMQAHFDAQAKFPALGAEDEEPIKAQTWGGNVFHPYSDLLDRVVALRLSGEDRR